MFKHLLISFLFVINLYSNDVFLLPNDSKEAQNKISSLILEAKSEIFIAMYNFSYNKFANDLIKASKNGVKITVLFDKEKTNKDDEILDLLKSSGIKTIVNKDKNKMHLKVALIDSKIAIVGSTNWTKKSFEENYDLILISEEKKLLEKLIAFKNGI
ncbi:MAG: phospholipase D-like domain-containing protein [Arcobacter sp.]|uniref:phospholipase D-like domain-containing protein n=1 Tax=Arcobacter sp. TaxID=1872629 RepID=UPI002A753868|nr:phospholipase D-like domain-containing protein [Arcobacter sp.]MDY3204434.1 phospholipase D-like domain-containing protein [Arcobacter sp.]